MDVIALSIKREIFHVSEAMTALTARITKILTITMNEVWGYTKCHTPMIPTRWEVFRNIIAELILSSVAEFQLTPENDSIFRKFLNWSLCGQITTNFLHLYTKMFVCLWTTKNHFKVMKNYQRFFVYRFVYIFRVFVYTRFVVARILIFKAWTYSITS